MQTLETERLILRAPRLSDALATQRYLPHWNVVKYLSTVPWPYPDNAAEEYLSTTMLPGIENGSILAWAITIKSLGDELVGLIDIQASEKSICWGSRGFWLAEQHWAEGYMREATEAVNQHVFEDLELKCFEARNAVENTASSRLKSNGVGRLVRTVTEDCICGPVPTEVWEIHRDDWLATHPN